MYDDVNPSDRALKRPSVPPVRTVSPPSPSAPADPSVVHGTPPPEGAATGGADAIIDVAAPPVGLRATAEARLRADEALIRSGSGGHIDECDGVQLDDTVRALGGIVNATHGRMVLSVCRVLETGWWCGGGILSARQWLALRWATSTTTVSRVISVAKKAENYPEVVEALVAGTISLEAAHLICLRTPPEYQGVYVAYATNMTLDQLRTCTHAVRPPSDTEPTKPDEAAADAGVPDNGTTPDDGTTPGHEEAPGDDSSASNGDEPVSADPPSHVGFGYRDDGRWSLTANLNPDEGALFEAALQDARDRAFNSAEDPDERVRLSWADALIDLANRSLDRSDADTTSGRPTDRTLVHYHYELGHLYLEGSTQPLPDALRRQILCDTNLVGIGFRDGRPVDVGRQTRVIPRRLRRLIARRDRCCVIPGCGATRGLEIHHLIHWEDGGPTDADNLVALCKAHHRAHHRGLVRMTGDPYSGLAFTNADGTPLCARPATPPPDSTPAGLTSDAAQAGMVDPATHRFGATGERLHRWSILPGPSPVPPRPPDLSPIRCGQPDDEGGAEPSREMAVRTEQPQPAGTREAETYRQTEDPQETDAQRAVSQDSDALPPPWWVLDPPTFDPRPLIRME